MTLLALVRPLPGVGVHVVSQQIGQSEALVAEVALVRFVSVMGQHMVLELGLVAVAFATARAAERLLLVQLLVSPHVLQEGKILSTIGAFVRLFARVDNEMLLQVAAESETLATHFALVRLVLGMYAHV